MRRTLFFLALCMMIPAAVASGASGQSVPEDADFEEVRQDIAPAEETPLAEDVAPLAADLMSLLGNSTEDQRTRMFRFIRYRYPRFTTDLSALLQSRQPGIFVAIEGELQVLIASRYPRLAVEVQRVLQDAINERYPQVRKEIAELIARDYPDVLKAMGETGFGDPVTHTARVIRERRRALLNDVRELLRKQHPTLLQETQREVLVRHPDLLAETAGLISERYPTLSCEVTEVFAQRYPELIPGLLNILAPAPVADDVPAEQ